MEKGDIAYIVETNNHIREVEVIKASGGFITVKYRYTDPHYINGGKHHISGVGGMRLRNNRIFKTRKDAEDYISKINEMAKNIEDAKVFGQFK